MSVLTRLFGGDSNEQRDGLDALAALLSERQATLALDATYEKPTVNMQGEPTAVFPITLQHDGDDYGAHAKEFAVPDNGLDEADAPLVQFLADACDIDPEAVTFEDLKMVKGMTADARLNEDGEITVDAPEGSI